MSISSSPILFTVTRHEPRLVVLAESTPRELKQLSDIDDQEGLRFQVPVIMFYKRNPSMEGKDLVRIIREALARALVVYYPFAGRFIEGPNRKLVVDCTGEGVLFIEADAEVELDQLGDTILRGCPYMEELLHHVPGSDGILGCALLVVQVKRFSCGGFTFALRLNHTMSDAPGLVQFLNAIAEFAQGNELSSQSVLPVWRRELLSARKPPRITCLHHEFEQLVDTNDKNNNTHEVLRSFFFGPKEIRAIRNHLSSHSSAYTFEVLTACLWRCRICALALDPNYPVRVSNFVNGRGLPGLLVPNGYYGNVIAYPTAVSKAGKPLKTLEEEEFKLYLKTAVVFHTEPLYYSNTFPLVYTLELIKMAKAQVTAEYFRLVADLMVIKGWPMYTVPGNFFVYDVRYSGLNAVDFGWGKPVYSGTAVAFPNISFYMSFKDGIVVPICLPQGVMERFEKELKTITDEPLGGSFDNRPSKISSML